MSRLWSAVRILAAAALTAVVTLALAQLFYPPSRSDRIDENAQTIRNGTASIVCILRVNPYDRTDATIRACLAENGYTDTVHLPKGTP